MFYSSEIAETYLWLTTKQDQMSIAPTLVSVIPSVNQSVSSVGQSVRWSIGQSVNQPFAKPEAE